MKLQYFSAQTLPKKGKGNKGNPRISFHKNGTISFNHPAITLMSINPGDKITLTQDEEAPENFYIFKDPQHGFQLRKGYDKKGGCVFNHSELVKTFVEAIGRDAAISHSFLIAGTATMLAGDKSKTPYWGVLINS